MVHIVRYLESASEHWSRHFALSSDKRTREVILDRMNRVDVSTVSSGRVKKGKHTNCGDFTLNKV
jgi:hypothetical protein